MAKLADSVRRVGPSGSPDGRMTLMEHIRELRNRLLKVALAIILGMVIGLVYFRPLWNTIQRPFCTAIINGHTGCHGIGDVLVINGVFDSFMLRIKIAFFVGLILTLS